MAKAAYKKDYPYNEGNMRDPRINRICLFEDHDINWFFEESELMDVKRMWSQEIHVNYMTTFLNRKDTDEIVLAVMHLAREGKLEKRKSGLLEGVQGPYDKKGRF